MTTEVEDFLLKELQEAVDPIISEIDGDMDTERAVFLIAASDPQDENGQSHNFQTYFDCAGDHGIIQEALYNILTEKLDQGSPELFQAIREVVREIEQERDIEPDESIEMPRVYH